MILKATLTRLVPTVVAVCLVAFVPACSSETPVDRGQPSLHMTGTEDYRPGVAADVYLPDKANPTATVVLVPGGGWQSADRTGLAPLAETLARAGFAVVNTTYRAADSGAVFPVPVQDIKCAIGFAADRVESAGRTPGPLVVVGHSSGAHLAALAALSPEPQEQGCPYKQTPVDGLVGLSGPYDISALVAVAAPLFGDGPLDRWRRGNPLTWASERPEVPVLLVHGGSDELVPVSFTQNFASALQTGGHEVQVKIVPGAGHGDVYRAKIAAPLILTWIQNTLTASAAG
jgi:acetyl esterase/lipase